MNGLARAAAVAGMSIGIALMLALLPQWDRAAGLSPVDRTVFQPERPAKLTDDNLVDALVRLPLQLDIGKADLHQSVLSIDLFVPSGLSEDRTVYHDLYELSQFGLAATSNIEQVMVRVLERQDVEGTNRQLLLAMDSRREQAGAEGEKGGDPSILNVREFLESRYHLTYTQEWKRVFFK